MIYIKRSTFLLMTKKKAGAFLQLTKKNALYFYHYVVPYGQGFALCWGINPLSFKIVGQECFTILLAKSQRLSSRYCRRGKVISTMSCLQFSEVITTPFTMYFCSTFDHIIWI